MLLLILLCFFSVLCINANSPPKLAPVFNTQLINVNSSFQILCSVREGRQPFFFVWHKNNQVIKSASGNKWNIESSKIFSTMTIERIDKDDAGQL